ncbi:MAG: glycine zipper 2TM domain-containing protein [Alphaproteobacteria bacterium]|nr:glycine zipper 2TM domain-containing protein [Alphaproteobacteria bacterium]
MKRSLSTLSLALLMLASLSLGACQSDNWGTKQSVGTLGGAAGGALLGNQFGKGTGNVVMTALGAVAGGWLGNEIGASLDNADRAALQKAQYRAYEAPVGKTIVWNNPENGNSGSFTPTREGRANDGSYCREFNQSVNIGGKQQNAYGTACRQPDGSWQIQQ